ncbi:MAG TPA: lipopolysaccharide biosynthesis protein [Casimicrobiaceae bacterium]|nr:lipopolysaccharide biosynthesis protein [Casimicrobiaceae bacterium]
MSSVRRSLAYTFAESYLGISLQIVSTLFLARLLTPEETGIWAVATVFAAVAATLHDFGAQEYLIQVRELTPAKIRAAMATNLLMSWTLAVLMIVSSGFVAEFYREPGVAAGMRVQAINFLLIPFGAPAFAYYRRHLNYRPFFIASTMSSTTSFVVAVTCAWAGLGYMSMAWSSLAGVIVSVLVATLMRPPDMPRMPSFRGAREVWDFGKHVTGIYTLGQIGKAAPELIIGRVLGMAPTAFFTRANGMTELFYRSVVRVALPVCLPYFAAEARRGAEVRAGFLRAINLLTVLAWPFFLFLALMAFPAIRILYGTQWLESVPLARLLCVVGAIEIVFFLAKDALIANDHVRKGSFLQTLVQVARVLGLVAGIPFGLLGICWGLIAGALIGAICSHVVLHQSTGLTLAQLVHACLPSAVIALLSAAPAVVWVAFGSIDEQHFVAPFVACGASGTLVWLLALRAMNHPLWREIANVGARVAARRARGAE